MKTKAAPKPERVFRAVSDETRLRILNLLRQGELCVCDLVSALKVPQPTASRHLAYLRRVGLVTVRKEGVWSYYALALAVTDFQKHLSACIDCCGEAPRMVRDIECLKNGGSTCCE